MNQPLLWRQQELDIVHESHQRCAELGVQVLAVLRDHAGARLRLHQLEQVLKRRRRITGELERGHVMRAVIDVGLAADIVGLVDNRR